MAEITPLTPGFELLSDHVVITDTDGVVLYANKAAVEKTGYSASEIIGKNPGKLWGGLMPKEFYESMWKTIFVDKKTFVGDVQNKKKDGSKYWAELRIFPVLDDRGDVSVFIGIEPDITERKEVSMKYSAEISGWSDRFVDRELKMVELKKEILSLKAAYEKK